MLIAPPPSIAKLTEPFGTTVPTSWPTVAVKVTLSPNVDALRLLVRVVAVPAWLTVCVSEPLLPPYGRTPL